jgi:hypothetical protein
MKKLLFILIMFTVLFAGCKKKQYKYIDDLEGEWTITHSERVMIYPDGTQDVYEDIDNAGTMSVYEANPPAETFKDFTFSYTNFQGVPVGISSSVYVDEDATRVGFSQVLCSSPFECDIVWTIEVDKKNKQVWAAYGTADGFFFPPDRYDPTNDDYHLVWRITLERD